MKCTSLDVISQDDGDYFIKMNVHGVRDRFIWNLVLVYGDAQPEGKTNFLAELSRVYKIVLILS